MLNKYPDYKKVSDALKRMEKEKPLVDIDWGDIEAPELDLEKEKDKKAINDQALQ